MLAGLPTQQKQAFCLQGAETYYYLNQVWSRVRIPHSYSFMMMSLPFEFLLLQFLRYLTGPQSGSDQVLKKLRYLLRDFL